MAVPATLDRTFDPSLTWAGALLASFPKLSRTGLQAAWESPEARAHRAILKAEFFDAYVQLVEHMRERLAELPKESMAA